MHLLGALMSHDNDARSEAEAQFQGLKESSPAVLLQTLTQILRECEDEQLRAFSAVLLRKSTTELWREAAVDAATRQLVKENLLASVHEEPVPHIRNKVSHTVSSLGRSVTISEDAEEWPELFPFVLSCCQSEDAPHRESGVKILGELTMWMQAAVMAELATVTAIFGATLSDEASGEVRLCALTAACKLLPKLEDSSVCAELLGPMVQVLATALSEGDETRARSACQELIELVDLDVKFLRPEMHNICELMLQVAQADSLDDDVRQLSVEFLVSTAEKVPGMFRKLGLAEQVLPVAMSFMLSLDDDDEWAEHDGEEEDSDADNYHVGEECMDRLGLAIGGRTVLPVLTGMLPELLGGEDWRARHAAVMALCQVAEGCAKEMKESLADVMGIILERCSDPHPRVRWAVCNALGMLSSDFSPALQNEYNDEVLGAISACMDDDCARVQSHAAAALVNFCPDGKKEAMAPHCGELLTKLYGLLSHSRKIVLDQALPAVGSMASVLQEDFGEFYAHFMPALKTITAEATSEEYGAVRAKAIECISLVGAAVGREGFKDDAHEVMAMLMMTQGAGLESDDPQLLLTLDAYSRICGCLKQDFAPYLDHIMPGLLRSAAMRPDVTAVDAEEELEGMETFQLGDIKFGIRTSMLEEKLKACNTLARFVEFLGAGFYPYIGQTAEIMIPLLKFMYDEDVRIAAASAMPELVRCAKLYAAANAGEDPAAATQLADVILSNLVEVIPAEPDMDVQIALLEALQEVVETGVASGEKAAEFLPLVQALWGEVEERAAGRAVPQSEDCDEEEWEALQAKGAVDDEMQETIAMCLAAFFKPYGAEFFGVMSSSGLLEIYTGWLGSEDDTLRKVAMWVWADAVQYCSEAATPHSEHFLPALLAYSDSEQPTPVRQSAAYALGVCAEHLGKEAFAPVCGEALERLMAIVGAEASRHEDNEAATDNAVSALGKMCLAWGGGEAGVDVLGASLAPWLAYLPCTGDAEEQKACNRQLCQWVGGESSSVLLGAEQENLPKVVELMLAALQEAAKDEDAAAGLAEEERATLEQMQGFLGGLQQSLPAEQLTALGIGA